MKILLSVRGYDSPRSHAVGNFELDQAKALRDAGHDVRLAAIDTRSIRHRRRWGVYTYELEGIPVWYASVPVGRLPGKPGQLLRVNNAEMLWKSIERSGWRPDIVHAHFGSTLLPYAREKGIATIYTEHSSHRNRILPAEKARQLREIYESCDAVVAVSRSLADVIKQNTGISARVISNCADCSLFSVPRRKHDGFRFVFAGNLIPSKRADLVLEAMSQIKEDCELVIFGSGAEEEMLRRRAAQLPDGKTVVFRGRCDRSELAKTYSESDCFVLPSDRETFGVAFVEAMAAGLPVIATRCGGPEDFVTPETGRMIPTDDTAALTDVMEWMLHNAGQYDPVAITEYVHSRFSPEIIASQLTGVYEEVLK